MATSPGATKIMVIRHAEKPGVYDKETYAGIDLYGAADAGSLVTLGWQRAGALAALFDPFYSVVAPDSLASPQFLFAADPSEKSASDAAPNSDNEPSQRPYQTILPLSLKLHLSIDAKHKKKDYATMVEKALARSGAVLVAWQHQDIPSIGNEILSQTGTKGIPMPQNWPGARYDLVWVFDRPGGSGPISTFTQVPQMLLAGDQNSAIPISTGPKS
jgi:hypothetical protein